MKRGRRRHGWIALALIGAGSTYLAFGPAGVLRRPRSSEFPPLVKVTLPNRGAFARVDAARWRAACAAAGLPDVAGPDGVEFESARRILAAAESWCASGDGDALGAWAEVELSLERHEAAIDLLAAACELGDERARWTYLLGIECQAAGRVDAALAVLEASRAADPDFGITHARLGELYFERGRLDDADAAFARSCELAPTLAVGFIGRGRVALEQRDVAGALGHLEQAVRVAPEDSRACRTLAQALARAGRYAESDARAALAASLPRSLGWGSIDQRLGSAFLSARSERYLEAALRSQLARSNFPEAIVLGEELLARRGDDDSLLRTLAGLHANARNFARAAELAERGLLQRPDSASLWRTRAEIAIAASDLANAERAAARAFELAPAAAESFQIRARARFVNGEIDAALADARAAVASAPDAPEHRRVLVDMLALSQRLEEARVELERVLARDPADAWALHRLQQLGR